MTPDPYVALAASREQVNRTVKDLLGVLNDNEHDLTHEEDFTAATLVLLAVVRKVEFKDPELGALSPEQKVAVLFNDVVRCQAE